MMKFKQFQSGNCFLSPRLVQHLENEVLLRYLPRCRWFAGKSREIKTVRLSSDFCSSVLPIVTVRYQTGKSERYLLPLTFLPKKVAGKVVGQYPECRICAIDIDGKHGYIIDAVYSPIFQRSIFRSITGRKMPLPVRVLKTEQSNAGIVYGKQYYLKLFRKLGNASNPEVEILNFLGSRLKFAGVPRIVGVLEQGEAGGAPLTIAVLQSFVKDGVSAWDWMIGQLKEGRAGSPDVARKVRLMARRIALMHRALSSERKHPDFRYESFSTFDLRKLSGDMKQRVRLVMEELCSCRRRLSATAQQDAAAVLTSELDIIAVFRGLARQRMPFQKIRIHGDLHLGQVLLTKNDAVIIDFEGEPGRPLAERRRKQSVLRDVAGMLRSFQYAARTANLGSGATEHWVSSMSRIFLDSYFETLGNADLSPVDEESRNFLLFAFLLDKAIYELGYELSHRPTWAMIPLQGIRQLMRNAPRLSR